MNKLFLADTIEDSQASLPCVIKLKGLKVIYLVICLKVKSDFKQQRYSLIGTHYCVVFTSVCYQILFLVAKLLYNFYKPKLLKSLPNLSLSKRGFVSNKSPDTNATTIFLVFLTNNILKDQLLNCLRICFLVKFKGRF